MKTRIWVVCLACVVVGFALSGLPQTESSGQDQAEKHVRTKWQYKIVYNPDLRQLDELGGDRWELVTGTVDSSRSIQTCYLKRPVQ